MPLDDETRAEIANAVREAMKPPVRRCSESVLQDSSCTLPWHHTGLHIDRDGCWRCPWCRHDVFMGHAALCPVAEGKETARE